MIGSLPVLEDELVRLRPLHADDWDALFAVARDPLIWAQHPHHDRWQEAVFRGYFDDGLASGGQLVAIDKASGAIIGASRYDRLLVDRDDEVEIGWTFLARSHWGGPWNRAMKRLMLAHAFERYATALFFIGTTNARSRRAIEKIGGVLTPRTRTFDQAGVPTEHAIYAITRADFTTGPLGASSLLPSSREASPVSDRGR